MAFRIRIQNPNAKQRHVVDEDVVCMMTDYRCKTEQIDSDSNFYDSINEVKPNVLKTEPNVGMEGMRRQVLSSNANYLNQSKNVALDVDENFYYHDLATKMMVKVENFSHCSDACSSNSDGQFHQYGSYVNTQEEFSRVPLQHVSLQSLQKRLWPQRLKQDKRQMKRLQNASNLQHKLQKPLPNHVQHQPLNDFEKQLPQNQLNISVSHQQPLGFQNNCSSLQQRRMVGRNQHPLHIFGQPEVTSSLQISEPIQLHQTCNSEDSSNSSEEVDSKSQDQHAYMSEWVDKAYTKLQVLRERYSNEVIMSYKINSEQCLQHPPGSELAENYERNRIKFGKIWKFLKFDKDDLVHFPKDIVWQYLNSIESYFKPVTIRKYANVQHHEQLNPHVNHLATVQLQQNRNTKILFNPSQQGLPLTHVNSPQSLSRVGIPQSQENMMHLLQNGTSVSSGIRNALGSLQNSPTRSMQQYSPSLAHKDGSHVGLEQRTQGILQHDSVKTVHHNISSSQHMHSSKINPINKFVPTMSSLPPNSAVDSSQHSVNQQQTYEMPHMENMKQPRQELLTEKNQQQTSTQNRGDLHPHKSNFQPEKYSSQSLTSSGPAAFEKQSGISPLSLPKNTERLETPVVPTEHSQAASHTHTLSSDTPGISPSPLITESDCPEPSQQSHAEGKPFTRLMNVVKSMSCQALNASLKDIGTVTDMVDNLAGPTYRKTDDPILQQNFMSTEGYLHDTQDRHIMAVTWDSFSSTFSTNDNFEWWSNPESDLSSTVTYNNKKCRILEPNKDLSEEIRAINQQLVETLLDVDVRTPEDTARACDGTIIRCSYTALGSFAESLTAQNVSSRTLPNFILRLLVPVDYPISSPKVLDTLAGRWSENPEDVIEKLKMKFDLSAGTLPQPMSLQEMAITWDRCSREVFIEYAEQKCGTSLSSRFGTWENFVYSP